jgi:hypothetical protein
MENANPVTLLLNYKQTSNYGFNVILGALDAYLTSPDLHIEIVNRDDRLFKATTEALEQRRRVVVAWSF